MNRHQVEIFHLLLLSSTNSSLNWDKKRARFRGGKRWKKESSRFKEERATQKRELGRVYAIRHIRIITTTGMPVDCGMLCANASRHLHHFYQIQLFLEFFFLHFASSTTAKVFISPKNCGKNGIGILKSNNFFLFRFISILDFFFFNSRWNSKNKNAFDFIWDKNNLQFIIFSRVNIQVLKKLREESQDRWTRAQD